MRDRRLDQQTRYAGKGMYLKAPQAPTPDPLAWATSGPGNTAIGHAGQPRGCGPFEARLAVRAAVREARAEVAAARGRGGPP